MEKNEIGKDFIMKNIRTELDEILIKIGRLKDISELLGDFFFNNYTGKEHSKGDTLVTSLIEKIQELDSTVVNFYKSDLE